MGDDQVDGIEDLDLDAPLAVVAELDAEERVIALAVKLEQELARLRDSRRRRGRT